MQEKHVLTYSDCLALDSPQLAQRQQDGGAEPGEQADYREPLTRNPAARLLWTDLSYLSDQYAQARARDMGSE